MSETKPVTWFADDPKPNTYFFRSPFRSGVFLFNTVLAATLLAVYGVVAVNHWDVFNQHKDMLGLFIFPLFTIIYPYLDTFREHSKINEIYLCGKLSEQVADSPVDQVLKLAADSMNTRLLIMLMFSGLLFFCCIFPKIS